MALTPLISYKYTGIGLATVKVLASYGANITKENTK